MLHFEPAPRMFRPGACRRAAASTPCGSDTGSPSLLILVANPVNRLTWCRTPGTSRRPWPQVARNATLRMSLGIRRCELHAPKHFATSIKSEGEPDYLIGLWRDGSLR